MNRFAPRPMPIMYRTVLAFALLATLAGCDQLGIESAAQTAARQEAEGKAVGGACRYSGRALEDCYAMNKRASKAAIYAGWRDMDGYMRENKIDIVPSHIDDAAKPADAPAAEAAAKPDAAEAPAKAKAADKGSDKATTDKTPDKGAAKKG